MSRTFIRQDAQIQPSDIYDDSIAASANMESSLATNIQDDLNNLRSQVKRILNDAAGNWYDDIPTVNSKQRDLTDLNTDLDDLEEKKVLCRVRNLVDIAVGVGDNFVILDFAGGEAPSQNKATIATTDGAVTVISALTGAGFEAHELIEVAGPDTLNPKNLLVVRDATTGQRIQSAGRDVFGLLQVEASSVDDEAFSNVATKRAKISFVRPNAALNDLEAVPVADIESTSVNYAYVRRINFDDVPEDCFLSGDGNFTDHLGAVDIDRATAYENQGSTPVELGTDAILDLDTAGVAWRIRDAANANLFSLVEGSAGGTSAFTIGSDVDAYVNDAVDVEFGSGISVGADGTEITINETAGQIDRAADLRIKATGAGELYFSDSNEPGSWSLDGIKLSENAASWENFETEFGEVSLLDAIYAAAQSGSTVVKTYAVATANVAADANVGGPATANNLDTDLHSLVGWVSDSVGNAVFVAQNDVYLNGVLLFGGINAAANNDFYPGTTDVQLKFEFAIKGTGANPDVLCVITRQ